MLSIPMPLRRGLLLAVAMLAAGCSADMIPFSSGAIERPSAELPASWAAVAGEEVIELETQPEEPYSVKLWVVVLDDVPYVHAGANRATWVGHIESDPRVRLGADAAVYDLQAERVPDQEEFDRFSDSYEEKYGRRPRNENVSEAYLYRLVPRDAG
ncbi:MAG: hypothetical protein AAGE43_07405 [Pseudomonadota bacterium]